MRDGRSRAGDDAGGSGYVSRVEDARRNHPGDGTDRYGWRVTLLTFLVGRTAGYLDNSLRQDLWRAGHAHAAVYLVLSLVLLPGLNQRLHGPPRRLHPLGAAARRSLWMLLPLLTSPYKGEGKCGSPYKGEDTAWRPHKSLKSPNSPNRIRSICNLSPPSLHRHLENSPRKPRRHRHR